MRLIPTLFSAFSVCAVCEDEFPILLAGPDCDWVGPSFPYFCGDDGTFQEVDEGVTAAATPLARARSLYGFVSPLVLFLGALLFLPTSAIAAAGAHSTGTFYHVAPENSTIQGAFYESDSEDGTARLCPPSPRGDVGQ